MEKTTKEGHKIGGSVEIVGNHPYKGTRGIIKDFAFGWIR